MAVLSTEDMFIVLEAIELLRSAKASSEFGNKTVEDARQEAIEDIGTADVEPIQTSSGQVVRGKLNRLELAKLALDDLIRRLE